jgi:hypothetical protein
VKTGDATRETKVRGDINEVRAPVKIERERARTSSEPSVTSGKRTGDSDKSVSKVTVTKSSKEKSGGLKGFVSAVAKSVKEVASKGDNKVASKSASKSDAKASAKSAKNEVKKAETQNHSKVSVKKR